MKEAQGQTPSGDRPRAQKSKPLAIPYTGLQATAIFNASHSLWDDPSIIKHQKEEMTKERLKLITARTQDGDHTAAALLQPAGNKVTAPHSRDTI